MEHNRNWQGWAALALAALALIITFTGRGASSPVTIQMPGAAAVAPAGPQNGPQAQQNDPRDWRGPRDGYGPGFGQGYGPGYNQGYGPGFGRGFHHGGPFFFLGGIVRFLGFLLIIGLLFRFFAGRRRGWGRPWGGPPWTRGYGHCGPGHPEQQPQESQQPQQSQQQTSHNDEPTTGETTRL